MRLDKSQLGKVLAFYASACFVVLQVVDLFQGRLDLPEWVFPAALILLIVGLPIVVTTAIVQSNDFKSAFIEKSFTWRRAIGGGVLAFVLLAVGTGFYARDRFGGNKDLDTNLVAVFPFRVNGAEASLHYLSEGMVDLLGAKLSGDAGIRAADSRTTLAAFKRIGNENPDTAELVRAARSIGARRMILGAIVGNNANLTITASVTDTRTGHTVQHFVSGAAGELPQKVDELAAVLLSLNAGEPRYRLATLTSTSLDAVRAYLLAEDAYRRSDHAAAARYYSAALHADSTFALAGLGVIVAQGWGASVPGPVSGLARRAAWRHREKLSEVDRLKLIGYLGAVFPRPESEVPKCRVWQQIIQREPEHAEAWHDRADCIYHYWKFMGLENGDGARALFEKSLSFDSTFMPNVQHLIPIVAAKHEAAEAKRLLAIFLAQDTGTVVAEHMRWFTAYAQGKPRAELLDSTILPKGNVSTLAAWAIDHTDDMVLADSLTSLMLAQQAQNSDRGLPSPFATAIQALWRGRTSEAKAAIARMDENNSSIGHQFAIAYALYAEYDSADAARRFRLLEQYVANAPAGSDERAALCVVETWRAWQGDFSQMDATQELLRTSIGDTTKSGGARANAAAEMCALELEAIRATLQRRPDAKALALKVDSISAEFPQWTLNYLTIRLLASRLLEMNGEPQLARVAVLRFPSDMGIPWLREGELMQHARLSVRVGDREAAIRDYRRYLALRNNPDGAGARATEQAQRELAALTGERR